MAPETILSSIEAIPHQLEALPRCKFRVRFRKAGDLRFVSHHDLMHVFERMFRRADLPVAVTQGFNPRPRIWFALSLALGIDGLNEVLELELLQSIAADELCERIERQRPPGLEILSVRAIDVRSAARVRRAWYRLDLPRSVADLTDLAQRCRRFLALSECWIDRTRPHARRVNLRPYVDELRPGGDGVEMALWVTPNGSARPEEIVAALGMRDLLDAGAVIARTDLEIYDELPAGASDPPVIAAAIEKTTANDEPATARPTAIVDNPMSFDS